MKQSDRIAARLERIEVQRVVSRREGLLASRWIASAVWECGSVLRDANVQQPALAAHALNVDFQVGKRGARAERQQRTGYGSQAFHVFPAYQAVKPFANRRSSSPR